MLRRIKNILGLCNHDWVRTGSYFVNGGMGKIETFKCSKCGAKK